MSLILKHQKCSFVFTPIRLLAAWTPTPADTAPQCGCSSIVRKSSRTWPPWWESCSSSSTNPLASSPPESSTIATASLRASSTRSFYQLWNFSHSCWLWPFSLCQPEPHDLYFELMQVLQHELLAIREACIKLEKDYQPGITFVVVQKRHHTRLFCMDRNERVSAVGWEQYLCMVSQKQCGVRTCLILLRWLFEDANEQCWRVEWLIFLCGEFLRFLSNLIWTWGIFDFFLQVGKSGNIPAGTTVDTKITHPSEFDFYLCSHAGIQVGTDFFFFFLYLSKELFYAGE